MLILNFQRQGGSDLISPDLPSGRSLYHGVERQGGVPRLYRTIFKFDAKQKVKLVRWVVQVVAAAYLHGCAPDAV